MAENNDPSKSRASCDASTSEIPYFRHSFAIVGISFNPAARCASSKIRACVIRLWMPRRNMSLYRP